MGKSRLGRLVRMEGQVAEASIKCFHKNSLERIDSGGSNKVLPGIVGVVAEPVWALQASVQPP